MAKIKFTKTELKSQQDALKQFVRFLPTLQLKKQQLQMEVRLSTEELERNLAEQKELVDRMSSFLELFSSDAEVAFFEGLVRVRRVLTGEENIAGIAIPTFDRVEFEPADWDLFDTEWYVDDAVQALKDAVSLREAYKVLEEQHRLLSAELRSTSQRVNLFEKVKIPECKENIRRIRIMLGDLDTSAVARSKIAKKKSQEAAEQAAS
ncbi:V-type ATP synthase subunit D [Victivallaceae bacterium BBE-744-WT-12]|jgi:V-type ATPase, D subunit|uniref:V-type ATP synthase subunit D n=1 Tax=Victivallis lenta TaxID=2606640 RepID=A0A844G1N7_9BACT|nr:V-type ATP synthase subunit D [Victivallis lenta]MBS1454300.1 V-type ATP synthase subunit D [Lentisphaeria bacterium]MBS5531978.1 V-type ATP synthase subunit D [bacterium]MST97276.1 V-type ATP synthase subunit D [Victivallis lenta]HBP05949.1 V-type ATP synthase subunit D [Lentisphaeria bacterium]HCH87173.1 V-type ATP synthase subunit D [Lentisphaeria bacterium]